MLTLDQKMEGIGDWARFNESEALAEAMGDYITNGEKANPFSLQIVKVLKKRL